MTKRIDCHLGRSTAVMSNYVSRKSCNTNVSTKQKGNTRSSIEAELVSIDDVVSKILWTKLFLTEKQYSIKENITHRDNQSSLKLKANGKISSTKRTSHYDIKYFYTTDLINKKEVSIKYCPTKAVTSDYMTKPLTGHKFKLFGDNKLKIKNEAHQLVSRSALSKIENLNY
jgi:hypothetical protein